MAKTTIIYIKHYKPPQVIQMEIYPLMYNTWPEVGVGFPVQFNIIIIINNKYKHRNKSYVIFWVLRVLLHSRF